MPAIIAIYMTFVVGTLRPTHEVEVSCLRDSETGYGSVPTVVAQAVGHVAPNVH